MVSALESLLRSVSADFATAAIIVIIITIFIVAVVFTVKGKYEGFTGYAPVLLTSVGILGTFIGISIGLIHFDPNNINDSISELLGGMKTAFLSSLVGMSFSIILKITQQFIYKREEDTPEEFDAADMVHAMNKQQESLASLLTVLGSESDTSILSQMKLLRGDINDNNKMTLKVHQETSVSIKNIDSLYSTQKEEFREFSDKLWIKLQDFADILSKSATETIIEALRQVIIDFNTNLTEQFGENFKELNNAVTDLVTWQENYKEQLEQMTEQYKLGVTAITVTEASVGRISEDTQAIPPAMDKLSGIMGGLSDVMEVNQQQLSELAQHLAVFEDMRDKAVAAVPVISEQIDSTVKAIAASVESATAHYNNLLEETGALQESVTKNIENMQNRLEATLEEVFASNSQNMEKTFSSIDAGLKTQVERTGEVVKTQLDMIDQSMQEELNRVMNAMGQALGQITNQFVNDYTRLVEQMNAIVSANRNQ